MQPRRLYLDNAATSFPKPKQMLEAMTHYANELGASPGRGGYAEAIESSRILGECRQWLNKLFNGASSDHFIFTLNCSDALNLAIHGLIGTDTNAHVICSEIEHNSILRPLSAINCRVTYLPIDDAGLVDPAAVEKAITRDTKLIATTHASNVTGTVQNVRAIGQIARNHDIPLLVDCAQSAGHLPIDLHADFIDLLAAPGHKGLLGPSGTGFLYIRPGLERLIKPVRHGGTGSKSELAIQPEALPDKYEPGSHNIMGIAGLSAAVQWVAEQGVEKLAQHDRELTASFLEGISDIPKLTYYGPRGVRNRLGVFSINIEGFAPHELAGVLESNYGILTRAGLHCAPFVHQAIKTTEMGGAVRFSFGPFLNLPDVQYVTDAIADIATSI